MVTIKQVNKKKIICKSCNKLKQHVARGMCYTCYKKWYYNKNKETIKEHVRQYAYKNLNRQPYNLNKKCSTFLGIHVAEQVLSKVFKNIKIMPPNNPGYDFICNKGMKIDVKSACITKRNNWCFGIYKNKITDYFLCIAFDNRKNINPLHLWLIPKTKTNNQQYISISKTTISKWDEYKLDITKTLKCCDDMKHANTSLCR